MPRLLNERKYIFATIAVALIVVSFLASKAFGASGLDDDVKLLLHGGVGDNIVTTLRDSSFSDHTVTLNGDAKRAVDKFNQSGFFDGSGDFLSVPDSADFAFGSGDFTIDFWVRPTETATQRAIVSKRTNISSYGPFIVAKGNGSSNGIYTFYSSSNGSSWNISSGTNFGNVSINTWQHIAVTRSGNTVYLFVDGVLGATVSTSASLVANSESVRIGGDSNGLGFLGNIEEVHISKGVARWTANFTPPTSPYTSDGNTSLLLHMDGTSGSTTFTDSTGSPKTVTANGNAHISSFSKFGGDGISFDGNGDYLSIPSNSVFEFGTGDFTVDFWAKFNVLSGLQYLYDPRPDSTQGAYPSIYVDGTTLKYWVSSADRITSGTTLVINTWYHIAVARSGTQTKLFLNGVQQGSTYTDSNNYISSAVRFGRGAFGAQFLNGSLDEVRISKGVARWTSDFTPPTEAYGLAGTNLVGNVKFLRNIAVIGSLSKGAGTFVIDHPQKPRTHLLYHSFVESNEVKNLYDGIVELDANGEAVIRLPDYFEELNKDFRYQYFPIGAPMPNLYVKEKVKNNQFVLAGGKPGGRVSWQVTGVRHDPYIEANPLQVEVEKGPGELVDNGECLHAEACQ